MNWSRCRCGDDDGSDEDTRAILSHFLNGHVGAYLAFLKGRIEKNLSASIVGSGTVAGRSAEGLDAVALRLSSSSGSWLLVLYAVRE